MGRLGDRGYLKIGNEADRVTVASILYKNGYTTRPVRRKKNGKNYEYFVRYELNCLGDEEGKNEG